MVKLIVWIAIGLLALSFFGISLKSLIDSPTNQENVSFLTQLLQQGWNTMAAWLHTFLMPFFTLIHIQPPF